MNSIRPRIEEDSIKQHISNRKSNNIFAEKLYNKMVKVFSELEIGEDDEIFNITEHILNGNIEQALEDATPLFAYFNLMANKAGYKEEFFEESLKSLQMSAVTEKGKVTSQKGGVRTSKLFIDTQKAYLRMKKIRKDCESLAKTMDMRLKFAQSKGLNLRKESEGSFLTQK